MRLPNGFGSVYYLGKKRRRPFVAMITTGWVNDEKKKRSKQIRKAIGYFATKEEAITALGEYAKKPFNVIAVSYTFEKVYNDFVAARYTNTKIPNYYTSAYKRCQPLHQRPFREIRTADLQALVDGCTLSYSTKKALKILLSVMYNYAIAEDICTKNYASYVTLPPPTLSRLHVPFSDAELTTLWANSSDAKIQTILIMIYTGFRPTELFKVKTVNVHLAEKYIMGGMKTAAGTNRLVPIADKILPFVTKLYNPGNEYLLNIDGGPFTYDLYRWRLWNGVMAKLQLKHLPHDCRHTCATLLDNANTNQNIIRKILGHAGSNIEEKVYIHKNFVQLLDAINKI